jgi:hypothetical protein
MTEAGRLWGFDGEGRYAHGGFLHAALKMREEIENSKILKKLSGESRSVNTSPYGHNSNNNPSIATPLTSDHQTSSSYSHYRVMVTGHSLGAGTAVLLAWLLKDAYPSLHCYAYGTPGSVCDEQSCKGRNLPFSLVSPLSHPLVTSSFLCFLSCFVLCDLLFHSL